MAYGQAGKVMTTCVSPATYAEKKVIFLLEWGEVPLQWNELQKPVYIEETGMCWLK